MEGTYGGEQHGMGGYLLCGGWLLMFESRVKKGHLEGDSMV